MMSPEAFEALAYRAQGYEWAGMWIAPIAPPGSPTCPAWNRELILPCEAALGHKEAHISRWGDANCFGIAWTDKGTDTVYR
jgi:hypothetical protein